MIENQTETQETAETTSPTHTFSLQSRNPLWNVELQSLVDISKTDFPVLLLGPSGTGKDVLAQAIHKSSPRENAPFICVNCSALTETLIESELFGHIKGAFTGAVGDRKGAFESARHGTLFLDEIGDLPFALQAKLLRALENSEIRPVGSDKVINTDVRIIAATHQNLSQKIQEGQFRSDLFFRLNVVSVYTPPLKDRIEDFEDLLNVFAKQMRVRFSYDAIQKLKMHTWPGNIRELRNLVFRAAAVFPQQHIDIARAERLLKSSSVYTPAQEENSQPRMSVIKEVEKQIILKKLQENKGNQRRTAQELGMPKSTLNDRLRQYNINAKIYKSVPVSERIFG
ncbi:sigma-54 interaction domain-containing protein [Bdellovibrio sp. HCB337]|uniref:sigma-54 interaction domain-containing protein n=1 Tax=Bdellovibrio sp. HCB337 TaxID=3394358 RepID=UPI0039A53FCB